MKATIMMLGAVALAIAPGLASAQTPPRSRAPPGVAQQPDGSEQPDARISLRFPAGPRQAKPAK